MKNQLFYSFLFLMSCSNEELERSTLATYLNASEVVLDNVIACAASNETDDLVSVFLYPRAGASNIKYFEANSDAVDKDNFESYEPIAAPISDVFNGFMKKFDVAIVEEKWVIVTFEEDNKIHVSNPIRIKNLSKPTEYTAANVNIQENSTAPLITWQDGLYDDTVIYFQVISDADNNLLSGTYTVDQFFKYYELDNVVLNITPSTPPSLQPNSMYGFTLLAVSEDNWVNLFIERSFVP